MDVIMEEIGNGNGLSHRLDNRDNVDEARATVSAEADPSAISHTFGMVEGSEVSFGDFNIGIDIEAGGAN